MRVLITGATGFLGGSLARELRRAGHDTVGLIRNPAKAGPLEREGIRHRLLDLGRDDPGPALTGVDAVVHCAAITTEKLPYPAFHRVNVEGTERLGQAAAGLGVRFVHVSSVAVHGYGGGPATVDEESPFASAIGRWDHYTRSKIAGERVIEALGRDRGLRWTTLRVGLVYGPPLGRDTMPPRASRFPLLCIGGGDQVLPLVSVPSVSRAVEGALRSDDTVGRAYLIVDGDQPRFRDFTMALRDVGIERRPLLQIPRPLYVTMAKGCEALYRLLGRDVRPPFTMATYELGTRQICYDTSRARRELGWSEPLPLSAALERFAPGRNAVRTDLSEPASS